MAFVVSCPPTFGRFLGAVDGACYRVVGDEDFASTSTRGSTERERGAMRDSRILVAGTDERVLCIIAETGDERHTSHSQPLVPHMLCRSKNLFLRYNTPRRLRSESDTCSPATIVYSSETRQCS